MVSEPVGIVQDLAVVLLVATPMALASHYLKQPMMIAYILVGILIGPFSPRTTLIPDLTNLNVLAEVGLVFLLLAVGLEFPLNRLQEIGRPALVIAMTEAIATFAAGYALGSAFGFSTTDALFVGLAISVTSTVVVSQVLEELGVIHQGAANLVMAITVIEDVIVVSALGILQSVVATGSLTAISVFLSLFVVVVFITLTLTVGTRLLPPLINRLAQLRRSELLLIGVLGLTFGLSIVASFIGISVATGAFFAGVIVAASQAQGQVRGLMVPLKEVFGAIFFVSMGALMDVTLLPQYWAPVVALVVTAIGVKFVAVYLSGRVLRIERADARRAALTVSASGGELALVVGNAGEATGETSAFVLPLIGALTVVTSFLSPYLIRFAWRGWVGKGGPPSTVDPAHPIDS